MSAIKPIIDAVYAKATAIQTAGTFYDAVGGRISHGNAREEEQLMYATFAVIAPELDRSLSGTVSYDVTVQWDIWGARGDGAATTVLAAHALLFTLFDGASLTVTGLDRGLCTWNGPGQPMVDEDCWRVTNDLRIQGTDF